MANRRTQNPKSQKIDEDSDFDQDFGPSQDSVLSEGEQQRKLIAVLKESRQKEKAEKEKKSVKEKKFLQVAEKHLDYDLTQATNIIEEATKAVEVQYNAFVSKYTVQEDKIHGLWTQIQNEQAKLADIVNEQFQRKKKAITSTASAHLTALTSLNSACNESRQIIDNLIPPSYSDSDSDSDRDFDMSDGDN